MKPIAPLLTLLCCAALSSPAYSQKTIVPNLDESGRRGEIARAQKAKAAAQFDSADIDKDGQLTREEVAKVSPYLAENFDKRDLNKDGFLSWEEFVGHDRWPK